MYEADYSGTRWLASFAVDMLTAPCRILDPPASYGDALARGGVSGGGLRRRVACS